ncbi:MAG: ATP-binding cassette domain-containing protein [Alphaproteobacteria bacterium]
MFHKPIRLSGLSLYFPHKICFEDFSAIINYGTKIAIMGRNGCGKSSLIKSIAKQGNDVGGDIIIPNDAVVSLIPQVINNYDTFSGGERFNKSLTEALLSNPNVLLLDEPTNHLDVHNRQSLMRMLNNFDATVIVVTHDVELLRNVDIIWHIDNGKIKTFAGNYDDYIRENRVEYAKIERKLQLLGYEQKMVHESIMKEQKRSSESAARGRKNVANNKWQKIVGNSKASQGEKTSGRKKKQIEAQKQDIMQKKADLYLPENILPKFHFDNNNGYMNSIAISDGAVGYDDEVILKDINFSIASKARLAIKGDNGSGKTTLIKAILNHSNIAKKGDWLVGDAKHIGYLDQHYSLLDPEKTVLETIKDVVPNWDLSDIRKHLNDFLFRKNEEVNILVKNISGGEKARLNLALIAAKTPRFLILDEITNNIDLETRNHIISVLNQYQGAILAVSHDEDFLKEIKINDFYIIKNQRLEQIFYF